MGSFFLWFRLFRLFPTSGLATGSLSPSNTAHLAPLGLDSFHLSYLTLFSTPIQSEGLAVATFLARLTSLTVVASLPQPTRISAPMLVVIAAFLIAPLDAFATQIYRRQSDVDAQSSLSKRGECQEVSVLVLISSLHQSSILRSFNLPTSSLAWNRVTILAVSPR